jgi:hypothetical protein
MKVGGVKFYVRNTVAQKMYKIKFAKPRSFKFEYLRV